MRVFMVLLFVGIAIAGFGQAVYHLWNLLMPQIFGLKAISFWQAVGLMALCWILFGGLRGAGAARGIWGPRHRMRERWERMSPEEREAFRTGMRGRGHGRGCGPSEEGIPAGTPGQPRT
jgi:hypothetical protein